MVSRFKRIVRLSGGIRELPAALAVNVLWYALRISAWASRNYAALLGWMTALAALAAVSLFVFL